MEQRRTLGSLLHPADREEVKRRFVHRFTGDHRPAWVKDETKTPLQFANDDDWLSHTTFAIRKSDRRLDDRATSCQSSPTWPNNPELRK